MFYEGANKIQSSDGLEQPFEYVWDEFPFKREIILQEWPAFEALLVYVETIR